MSVSDIAGNTKAGLRGSAIEVLLAFLRLGVTSFGGPIAHLGYFRADIIQRRRWLDEASYADIVALCQFLPGPASSQVAVSLGMHRAGLLGGLAAWAGFSLPSALAMIAFAYGYGKFGDPGQALWLHGLIIVAVAVVAQAVWGVARNLCPDRPRATMAVAACLLALAVPGPVGQLGAIAVGALVGWRLLPVETRQTQARLGFSVPRPVAIGALAGFVILLVGLQVAALGGNHLVQLFDAFYRSGALVFGGGHVVLPLLQRAVVLPGWIGNPAFLAGYGAAQAVPGPLFTFAAFLGAAQGPAPSGWLGGVVCLVAIYLPSFLLLVGILPFWDMLRRRADLQATLRGVNAAVVGLLLAALYTPVWTSAIFSARDFAIAVLAFLALVFWKLPPWAVVLGGATLTALLGYVG